VLDVRRPAGGPPPPRLVRARRPLPGRPDLDPAQQAVVDHRGGPLRVLAGPGTGKTTTLVEAVVSRVEHDGVRPDEILVLTFSRRAAAELRERISARLARTVREPLARTFHSYAFGLLRAEAVRAGRPAPRLLTGAEQDLVVRELLAGDRAERGAAEWPERLRPALATRGFADELRDLLLRAEERGLSPEQLARLGQREQRPEWIAAGRFARQYRQVTALREHGQGYDPAVLVQEAAHLLAADEALLVAEREARRVVVVDEYQDADPAQEQLLALIAGDGRDLVVVGDPDQSIYAFRGSDPDVLQRFPERFRAAGGAPAPTLGLTSTRRFGPTLRDAAARVAQRLGGPTSHRRLAVLAHDGERPLEVAVLRSVSQEAALVAHRLRAAHLHRGVAWSRMAVVVRAAASLPILRRALTSAGVPVAVRRDEIPLVDEPAVRALLDVLEIAVGRRAVGIPEATDLVTGPIGAADPLALRRLRQELRRVDAASGGTEQSGALLVAALAQPDLLAGLDPDVAAPARLVADVLAAARVAAAEVAATAESVLWAAWHAAGLAGRWSRVALSGGAGAAAADRDLDAVVALFDNVARFVDRLPGAGPGSYLDQVRDQQVPGDTLAPRAPQGDAVTLLTAHAAKGLEWDVVAVVGVQEGRWPDLRRRGSLLGSADLLDVLAGREPSAVERMTAALAEERRLFYVAVTRARQQLLVTAVQGEDDSPSRFLDELDPPTPGQPADRPLTPAPRGLDLASVVAELRSVVAGDDEQPAAAAAADLARLAAAGVPGADPDEWFGLPSLSDDRPLRDAHEPVPVSPSRVEAFDRCSLRWLLESVGGAGAESTSQTVGSLVHRLAYEAAVEGLDGPALVDRFEQLWPSLDLGEGYAAAREHDRTRLKVERLATWLQHNPRELIAVEREFRVAIGRAVVAGRVDRLERDAEGRLVVVDIKTGSTVPAEGDVQRHPQLGTYQAAVRAGAFAEVLDVGVVAPEIGRVLDPAPATGGTADPAPTWVLGGAELVQLGADRRTVKVQQQPPLPEGDEADWVAALLAWVADGMAAGSFAVAATTAHCERCPVRTCCPVWPEGRQVTS
jgi:superfamily I DNA/RNA helicase/RecB family exonuclease